MKIKTSLKYHSPEKLKYRKTGHRGPFVYFSIFGHYDPLCSSYNDGCVHYTTRFVMLSHTSASKLSSFKGRPLGDLGNVFISSIDYFSFKYDGFIPCTLLSFSALEKCLAAAELPVSIAYIAFNFQPLFRRIIGVLPPHPFSSILGRRRYSCQNFRICQWLGFERRSTS